MFWSPGKRAVTETDVRETLWLPSIATCLNRVQINTKLSLRQLSMQYNPGQIRRLERLPHWFKRHCTIVAGVCICLCTNDYSDNSYTFRGFSFCLYRDSKHPVLLICLTENLTGYILMPINDICDSSLGKVMLVFSPLNNHSFSMLMPGHYPSSLMHSLMYSLFTKLKHQLCPITLVNGTKSQ